MVNIDNLTVGQFFDLITRGLGVADDGGQDWYAAINGQTDTSTICLQVSVQVGLDGAVHGQFFWSPPTGMLSQVMWVEGDGRTNIIIAASAAELAMHPYFQSVFAAENLELSRNWADVCQGYSELDKAAYMLQEPVNGRR